MYTLRVSLAPLLAGIILIGLNHFQIVSPALARKMCIAFRIRDAIRTKAIMTPTFWPHFVECCLHGSCRCSSSCTYSRTIQIIKNKFPVFMAPVFLCISFSSSIRLQASGLATGLRGADHPRVHPPAGHPEPGPGIRRLLSAIGRCPAQPCCCSPTPGNFMFNIFFLS